MGGWKDGKAGLRIAYSNELDESVGGKNGDKLRRIF